MAALVCWCCAFSILAAPTPTNRVDTDRSKLVELLNRMDTEAYGDRWELANIALDVLLSSYADAFSDSTQERPSSTARQTKLYRWQRATQAMVADIEAARDRLLVDSSFSIYADPRGQVILTIDRQPLAITGLGRDDDRTLHTAIVERFCAFNDCGDLLVEANTTPANKPLPQGHWQISQARQPKFIVDGQLECLFSDLAERRQKATSCRQLAKDIQTLRRSISAAGGNGVRIEWPIIAASRRPASTGTLLVLNTAGDYVTLDVPVMGQLSDGAWHRLVAHLAEFAELTTDNAETPHQIDGSQLLANAREQ